MSIINKIVRARYFLKDVPYKSPSRISKFLNRYVKSGYYPNYIKGKTLEEIRSDKFIRFLIENYVATHLKNIGTPDSFLPNIERRSLKIAFTINKLIRIGGTENWLREISKELHHQNIELMIYTPSQGSISTELKLNGITVTSQSEDVFKFKPSYLHLQHSTIPQITNLVNQLSIETPIFNLCHGIGPRIEAPYIDPKRQILYGGVSLLVRAFISFLTDIKPESIHLIKNFYSTERHFFHKTDTIRKAAIISSNVSPQQFEDFKKIFKKLSIQLDIYGNNLANIINDYSQLAHEYDLFLCTGKTAVDILGIGKPVILLQENLMGPAVISENIEFLSSLNFALTTPLINVSRSDSKIILHSLKIEIENIRRDDADKRYDHLFRSNSIDVAIKNIINIYSTNSRNH